MELAILTATYNHPANLLELYATLKEQFDKNFTWFIVDDGSKPETGDIVQTMIKESAINIHYERKENGGKSSAVNRGLDLVKDCDFVVIIDDDEHLYPNATQTIKKYYEEYKAQSCSVINFMRANREGNPLCNTNAIGDRLLTMQQHKALKMHEDGYAAYYVYKLGDIRFPLFKGEKYIGPSVLMMLASANDAVLWSEATLGTTEYLDGGITQSGRKLRLKNPKGMIYHALLMLNGESDLRMKFGYSIHAYAYKYYAGLSNVELKAEGLDMGKFLPVPILGWVLAKAWNFKYGIVNI